LEKSFSDWSAEVLGRLETRPIGAEALAAIRAADVDARLDEVVAQGLARAFTDYLHAARAAGLSDCTPGRFLLPGDLAGSPVLTFAPLPRPKTPRRGALWREFERRFEAYKREVVKPFFRDHFARIDRQIVLVDALGAIHSGPPAVEDLRRAMADILQAFRPGRNPFLARLFLGRRVERILFAATKADHLHHSQHGRLTAIVEALLADAKSRADFAGAGTGAMSIAALRATTEDRVMHDGAELDVVRGTLLDTGKSAAFHPGVLPDDPARILQPSRDGAEAWLDGDYGVMRFAPRALHLKRGEGPPNTGVAGGGFFLWGHWW
jgi:predicted YcjX-like family ATPase